MGVGNENGFFFNHNWWVYNFEIEINEKIEGGEHGVQTKSLPFLKQLRIGDIQYTQWQWGQCLSAVAL